jgi:hypothetical protein
MALLGDSGLDQFALVDLAKCDGQRFLVDSCIDKRANVVE